MDLPCHEQGNYSALFNRQEHQMARTKRIALDYDIDGKLSLSPCHTATNPWTMTLCPMMPPQSPRFLSLGRTTMLVALPLVATQKFGRSFHAIDNKQAPSILQHVLSTFE